MYMTKLKDATMREIKVEDDRQLNTKTKKNTKENTLVNYIITDRTTIEN